MGELEDFLGCTIQRDLTNMILNISQQHKIIKKQGFNKDVKYLMNLNTPDTLYKGIVCNQEKYKKIERYSEEIQEWCRITNITCKTLTTIMI